MSDNKAMWELYGYFLHPEKPWYQCSACKSLAIFPTRYCKCGAEMGIEEETLKFMPKMHHIIWKDNL